ncbi:MAG: DNA-formamidopyrimidine glycosylase family protein [Actinomycetota bacterium]
MPEGDTLYNTALQLRPALLGEPLTAVSVRARGMYRLRSGDVVRSVEAVGKFLEIVVERGLALRTHLHMTGVWHLYEQGERWRRPKHLARAVLETDAHVAVCFAAPTVEIGPVNDDRLAHLGPDLCHADVDLDAVLARVAESDPAVEIAEVLLDQRLAAGIGNVYKNEALWACEVSPFRPLAEVDEPTRRRLYETAAEQLQANLGRWRRQTHPKGLAVYDRAGQGCYRCFARIRTVEHGAIGRRTWWCPDCQV